MAGFFQVERSLLDRMGSDGNLTVSDFRVMMIAMRDTKLPGDSVALGIDYLADGTGLDRSTVIRSRRKLVRLGYLISDGFGQCGLACFTVVGGGVAATPGGAGATPCTDAGGGVAATPRGGVAATPFTLHETGNSGGSHNKDESASPSVVDEGSKACLSDKPPAPDPESSLPALALVSSTGKDGGGADVPPPAEPKRKVAGKAKAGKTQKPKTPDFPAWLQWVDACRAAGRDVPAPSAGAVKAAKTLTDWYPNAEERRLVMDAYLRLDDKWVRRQGYQLALLVTNCIEAVRETMRSDKGASTSAARSAPSGSTGEAMRRMKYLKDDGHTPRCGW